MRVTNLMLSACIAALALVSCAKEDLSGSHSSRMKSVEVSLENVVFSGTRGEAGTKINDGDAVVVNDIKIFLTDAAGNEYSAKTSNGSEEAQSYWSADQLTAGTPLSAQFHYVDPNCTKVVAVANLGSDLTFAEYKALANLQIGAQQNSGALALYAEEILVAKNEQHTDVNDDGTTYVSEVYEAALTLYPRISRFEVDGFVVEFNATPKFNTIQITDILFQNYYPETSLITGVESGELVNHIPDLANQSTVYNWFNATKDAAWYFDKFDLTITPAAPKADTPKPLAYHMFSCNTTPVMVIKLLADGIPAYIYTKGFYSSTEVDADNKPLLIEEFKEGTIYRMSAAGEVSSNGSIPIPEDKIDPMDRCIEITVDVTKWVVELVYPEF